MASVIASGITDERNLSKLKEFVRVKGEKAAIVESSYRHVECADLKTAIDVGGFVRNLKYGGN